MLQGDLDARTADFRQLASTDAAAPNLNCTTMEKQWEVIGMPKAALLPLPLNYNPIHTAGDMSAPFPAALQLLTV